MTISVYDMKDTNSHPLHLILSLNLTGFSLLSPSPHWKCAYWENQQYCRLASSVVIAAFISLDISKILLLPNLIRSTHLLRLRHLYPLVKTITLGCLQDLQTSIFPNLSSPCSSLSYKLVNSNSVGSCIKVCVYIHCPSFMTLLSHTLQSFCWKLKASRLILQISHTLLFILLY